MTIFLFFALSWTLLSNIIYVSRRWKKQLTLRDWLFRLGFVSCINFILAPYCLYKNLVYFYKKFFKTKKRYTIQPFKSFSIHHALVKK